MRLLFSVHSFLCLLPSSSLLFNFAFLSDILTTFELPSPLPQNTNTHTECQSSCASLTTLLPLPTLASYSLFQQKIPDQFYWNHFVFLILLSFTIIPYPSLHSSPFTYQMEEKRKKYYIISILLSPTPSKKRPKY